MSREGVNRELQALALRSSGSREMKDDVGERKRRGSERGQVSGNVPRV